MADEIMYRENLPEKTMHPRYAVYALDGEFVGAYKTLRAAREAADKPGLSARITDRWFPTKVV
jgi:hypothetical protein